ncbi:MAG: hypothetical protein AB9915_00690 [Candidatus Dojkabacteria bacterium]
MEPTSKNFFLFSPPFKQVKIYFSSKEDLNTELLKSLALKTLPKIYLDVRRNTIFYFLFNWISQIRIDVPDTNTFLIYKGYDSTIFFIKNNSSIQILRKKNGEIQKEDFLGYPIHYDFSLGHITNKELISKVLKEHWINLKNGKDTLHGDFTHSNILVDGNKKVTVIDSKKTSTNCSIITDHFYFYAYFMLRAKMANYSMKDTFEKELLGIYTEVFKDEDTERIIESIKELKLEDFNVARKQETFDFWRNEFSQFITKII